jgi:hypothetical protein
VANKYALTGQGIEIDYTIGINPAFTALTFKEGGNVKTFTPAQITTDHTGLGTLVSVPLLETIDTGGRRFGFFLPEVQVAREPSVPVTTIGAVETFSGPDSLPAMRRRGSAYICTAKPRRLSCRFRCGG